MKELSIKEKAELKESKDERIRQFLIHEVTETSDKIMSYRNMNKKDVIDWLEKQGKQKPVPDWMPKFLDELRSKKNYFDWDEDKDIEGGILAIIKWMNPNYFNGKDGEQKPTDKIEPKFKVGDWVVSEVTGSIYQIKNCIENLSNHKYEYDLINGGYINSNEVNHYHLWTIEDAKDGDVLAVEAIEESHQYPYPFVSIYKERGLDFFNSYCFIGFDGKFYKAEVGHSIEKIHPATKEQRGLLFKKMKEEGYEWDVEKKELKKIEQKSNIQLNPEEYINDMGGNGCYLKNITQDSAWSEEDERLFQIVIDVLDRQNHLGNISRTDLIACVRKLKSLKDRVQPKQEWSKEDETNASYICAALECYYRLREERNNTNGQEDLDKAKNWLYNRLKSIEPQSQWKPSNEQMKAFDAVLVYNPPCSNECRNHLITLYNDLKKLMEE